ncbi:hypothetical protein CPLU01_04141 [Colletotrichum plurivorum]|uniref:Uncharacterized protein n=1 Tax=Colletotrichum plurivorum TaxID=2175906 RepID=A0A8H6KR07_9PEZI|nr:hypothetical protein CPLU01_04141 [Colletotrichum plurivorum]
MGQAKWSWMATPRPLRHVERFDSASRGAWGSLKFLLFACRPIPTVLGALVVVASYATGPFSQQAVKTYRCETVSGVTHSSVGVCSDCVDVRSELQEFESFEHKATGRYRLTYRFHNNSQFGINTWVNPYLFGMTTDDSHHSYRSTFLTLTVAGCTAQLNEEARPNRNCEHDYENMPKLRSDVDIVAANCTLYPCLRHYYGNVTNGTLNEHLLSTEPMRFSNRSLYYDEYISTIQPCLLNNKWYSSSNITGAPRDGLNWTTWSSDGVSFEDPAQCIRSLHYREFRGVGDFLRQNLNGSCQLFHAYEEGSTSMDIIRKESLLDCDSGWWVDALYKGGNATFEGFATAHDNMATAITNRMRVNGLTWSETETSRSYMEGTNLETSICVRLHGLWLLYPAALLVLTSALLVTAYVQSCHDSGRQPIWWKSAILPLIFYSISKEQDSDERHGDPDTGSSVPLLQLTEL